MSEQQKHTFEERIRFVAKYYQEHTFDAERAWRRFADGRPIRRRLPAWIWQAAAVLLLALGGFTYYMMERQQPDWVVVATGADEQQVLLLPDSSCVEIAGGTELRYDARAFGRAERRVMLKGMGFFRVRHQADKPFHVQTAACEVTVLGTSFLVQEWQAGVQVQVLTGRVRFEAGQAEPVVLKAGDAARYQEREARIQVWTDADANARSWRTHELVFRGATLPKVIRDLETCYGVPVRNLAQSSDSLCLTATFRDMPLEEVLSVINQTLDTQLRVGEK